MTFTTSRAIEVAAELNESNPEYTHQVVPADGFLAHIEVFEDDKSLGYL
jgi:hypothetical protein